jgi:hypothetical protein
LYGKKFNVAKSPAQLSSGKAGQLTGMERVACFHSLDQMGVPAINLSEEEIDVEVRAARDMSA